MWRPLREHNTPPPPPPHRHQHRNTPTHHHHTTTTTTTTHHHQHNTTTTTHHHHPPQHTTTTHHHNTPPPQHTTTTHHHYHHHNAPPPPTPPTCMAAACTCRQCSCLSQKSSSAGLVEQDDAPRRQKNARVRQEGEEHGTYDVVWGLSAPPGTRPAPLPEPQGRCLHLRRQCWQARRAKGWTPCLLCCPRCGRVAAVGRGACHGRGPVGGGTRPASA